jgi:hypothetical protein
MKNPLLATFSLVLLLGACGGTGEKKWYNPFGWFGGSQEVATLGVSAPEEDPRPLVQQVLSMSVEQFPGGAIVRATGLPPTQGFWEAELLEQPVEDGRLTYRFVVLPPAIRHPVSTRVSREVTVATSVSNIKLEGIREIVVVGKDNARSSRR